MERRVLVVGSPMLDVCVRGARGFPRAGRTEVVDAVSFGLGGCALNTALILGRLGVPCAMAGLRGDDLPGRAIGDLLRDEPLDMSRLRVVEGARTTVCLVFIGPDGDRQFLIGLAVGETIALEHVGDLGGAAVVHAGAALQLGALDIAALFRRARSGGALTTLDVENGPGLDHPERLHACLEHVDWFMPSEEEALRATRRRTVEEAADALLDRGARGVLVKLGSRGCMVATPSGRANVAAPRVAVVDTTGAGDNFVAGFIAGLTWGLGAEDAARLACACGACAVTAIGATAAVRSRASVMGLVPEDLRERLRSKGSIDAT